MRTFLGIVNAGSIGSCVSYCWASFFGGGANWWQYTKQFDLVGLCLDMAR
jgi:hypothetical protein